jgi:hypothetical protein
MNVIENIKECIPENIDWSAMSGVSWLAGVAVVVCIAMVISSIIRFRSV